MSASVKSQWNQLRCFIDELELEIAQSDCPAPTSQMCEFLILGEDRRFYAHSGVDPIALCRAVWKTFFCGVRQGGSTIAMQLVRTVTGRYEKKWRRKIDEIFLAVRLTRYVSKDRLPILYLWVAYYGWRMNNFKQACARLQMNPKTASPLEAAKLVARLKYPEPQQCSRKHARKIHRRALYIMALHHPESEYLQSYQETRNEKTF